jgi:predicted Zn-dependent peptidase
VIHKDTATQQYVVQLANAPGSADEARYAARLLATILGDSSGSRMYWELFDRGLAECAVMETCDYQGAGIFMTYLCCAPEDTPDNLESIDQILRQAHADGVTAAELAQAKSKIRSHIVLQAERPANRLFSVGNNWIQRRQYRTVREIVRSYEAVTPGDIAAVLEQYPLTVNTTVAVGPLEELPLL